MSSRSGVFSSSVGTKIVIGLTGMALFLYLVVHIAGNALVFFGPTVFNQYSHVLLSNPLVPLIEIGLVIVFALHLYKTVRMFIANQQARPVAYVQKKYAGSPSRKTVASSTMIVSGLWLLLGAEYEVDGVRDLYRLEMENFANPLLVGFYVVSMLVVGSHLWHGIASAFQSIGADHPRWTPRLLAASKILAVAIAAGFVVIAVWAYVHQAGRVRP